MDSIFLVITALVGLVLGWILGRASRSDLANQVRLLESSLEQNRTTSGQEKLLSAMLEPLQKEVQLLRDQANQFRIAEAEQEGQIKTELERLRTNSDVLAKALGNNAARGTYGEGQLEGLLYEAGLIEGVHYETQANIHLDGTRIRPDAVIKLPGGSAFALDSKFPFSAYWNYIKEADENERSRYLTQHVSDVRARVKELHDRKYAEALDGPDFVVLFFPFESILQVALENDHGLMQFAADMKVTMTTPATLLAVLRTVSMAWQRNQLAENAQRIGASANEVVRGVGGLIDDVNKLGRNLQTAATSYNEFIRRFDNSFVRQVRSLQDLTTNSTTALELNGEISDEIRDFQAKVRELED